MACGLLTLHKPSNPEHSESEWSQTSLLEMTWGSKPNLFKEWVAKPLSELCTKSVCKSQLPPKGSDVGLKPLGLEQDEAARKATKPWWVGATPYYPQHQHLLRSKQCSNQNRCRSGIVGIARRRFLLKQTSEGEWAVEKASRLVSMDKIGRRQAQKTQPRPPRRGPHSRAPNLPHQAPLCKSMQEHAGSSVEMLP